MEFTDSPLEPTDQILLDLLVQSNLGYKTPLVFRIIAVLQEHGYLTSYGYQMAEVCFEEAIANAMVHGNKLEPDTQVRVIVFGNEKQFGVMVGDEGDGFGHDDLPEPNDPENLLRERGRGILIIEHYMDRTQFSLANNRLCMIRRRQTEPDPGAIPPSELPQVEPRSSEAAVEKLPFTPVDVERHEPKPVLIPESIELAPAISPAGDSQDAVSAGGMSSPILVEKRHDLQIASICESRITEDNARTIQDCLSEAAEQTVHFVVDMSAVEFMSSIGISAIVAIYKQIKRKKGQFVLSGVRPPVHSILKITGLLELIPTAPDQSTATQIIQRKE